MAKDMKISFLLDFYGGMLTKKQREVIELYYNDDLSLSEIAENVGITRQGVRDAIKRAEAQLTELEDRVGFAKRSVQLGNALKEICREAYNIKECNSHCSSVDEIEQSADRIISMAESLNHS
jgi:hypothetical protein